MHLEHVISGKEIFLNCCKLMWSESIVHDQRVPYGNIGIIDCINKKFVAKKIIKLSKTKNLDNVGLGVAGWLYTLEIYEWIYH